MAQSRTVALSGTIGYYAPDCPDIGQKNRWFMKLNEMLVFNKVVVSKSFTAAAKKLGTTKSTISRRISSLEERLGAQLLTRTTRQLQLTDAGSVLYEQSARLLSELEEVEELITTMNATPRGHLRIAVPVVLGNNFLGPLLIKYQDMFPLVTVTCRLTDKHLDLIEEGFDLSIQIGALSDSTLISRKLGNTRPRLCATEKYLSKYGTPKNPSELQEHQCMVFGSSGRTSSWTLKGSSGEMRISIQPSFSCNNFMFLREAVLGSRGIALLPEFICADDINQGKLKSVLDNFVPATGAVYVVYPSKRYLPARTRAFIDLLVERCSPPPWIVD